MIDVDLNVLFIVLKVVIFLMIKKGYGKIINICLMMSELGCEIVFVYVVVKGGLKMFICNIVFEYGEFNI